MPPPTFWAKAGAKVHTFRIPTKFFGNYFQRNAKVFGIYDKRNAYTLLYIEGVGNCIHRLKNISLFLTQKDVKDRERG